VAHGIVTWFDDGRGFGFISRAGFVSREGGDAGVYLDRSRINAHSRALGAGDHVRFTLEIDDRGLQACDVSVV
jgi:CspA family cold shock protein